MLVDCKSDGCFGGDLNCIINKQDATNHQEAKMSPCLSRMVKTFGWTDSFRSLHPSSSTFSRYYEARGVSGATRIDRQYQWGNIVSVQAGYSPVAFSDHLAHTIQIRVPEPLSRLLCPRSRPMFKVKEVVARDKEFQGRVKLAMEEWGDVRAEGLPVLSWWEIIVKPGIRKIAMDRSKEINIEKRERLNLLLLRQAYLVKKIQHSQQQQWGERLTELLHIQLLIQQWYRQAAEKIQHQARVEEFQVSEKTRIYHHEIHQKNIRKSSILKLQSESGLLEGHGPCSEYLEQLVGDLLLTPAQLDISAQDVLLNELETVVTAEENDMLAKVPDKEEVLETLREGNGALP